MPFIGTIDGLEIFGTGSRAAIRITPEQAGVPASGERRVPGPRRSEVAQRAGVSAEYYTRLERGNLGGVSESVLDALARALRLDEIEQAHLHPGRQQTLQAPGRRRAHPGLRSAAPTG